MRLIPVNVVSIGAHPNVSYFFYQTLLALFGVDDFFGFPSFLTYLTLCST